ncbi:MAG: hypothetical protein JNL88_01930 [Bacteroidia bacterium]|nr:hypothetical protein [Bacteroidia bacterium]
MKTPVSNPFLITLFAIGIFMITTLSSFAQSGNRIRFIFGTRCHPVGDGKGCEGEKGICIILNFKDKIYFSNSGQGEMEVINGRIQFSILSDHSPAAADENDFYVYEDKVVPVELAEELGYNSIVIKRGVYKLDKSRNPLGVAQLNAEFR